MRDQHVLVPAEWRSLELTALHGVLLVVGASDTGKSSFAHWLFRTLADSGQRVAFLDGDVGQSSLGPPTTMTVGLPTQIEDRHARDAEFARPLARWFVGDVTPRGRMLPLVVGMARLVQRSRDEAIEAVVIDTTGLVSQAHGGVALKHALADQLRPSVAFAFQRGDELEPVLTPWRRMARPHVVELPVSGAVRRRDLRTRQDYRARAFRRYFAQAEIMHLSLPGRAVFGGQAFAPRRLVALQDVDGFVLDLGVIVALNGESITVRTPLRNPAQIASIHLGTIGVDPHTGCEYRPGRGM
jgi:polynucleotide 5'-hydroxyl-kinase GRC3/NOL9